MPLRRLGPYEGGSRRLSFAGFDVSSWHFSEVVVNPGSIRLEIQIGDLALRVDRYTG